MLLTASSSRFAFTASQPPSSSQLRRAPAGQPGSLRLLQGDKTWSTHIFSSILTASYFRTGPHVFHGGFSTFLSVAAFALDYIMLIRTFFKVLLSLFRQDGDVDKDCCQVMTLLVWLGLFHALVALPALLSFLGPPPSTPDHLGSTNTRTMISVLLKSF